MKHIILILTIVLCGVSCTGFDETRTAEKVSPLKVNVNLNIDVAQLGTVKNLIIKLDNYEDGYHYTRNADNADAILDSIVPGIYTISVSGTAFSTDGTEYFINGNAVNKELYKGVQSVDITLKGLKISPLVFKEIYYAGSKPPTGFGYFRDQFYEIYNNSNDVQYLDGVYFAQLAPNVANKSKLPVWAGGVNNDVCYAERIWQFPGNGHDYPLQPGESAVIAQLAVNHKLPVYNPNSPVDCSHAEFEFFPFNNRFPDGKAINMIHVFYDGKPEFGKQPQFLTSVFGSAFAMFKVPNGSDWDPINNKTYQDHEVNRKDIKAKIPLQYVLDAVECINNETFVNAKRIPAVIDAGMTWVGSSYCGLGVVRKVVTENGDTIRRNNGAIILQDTNNSTDDFERGVTPMLHRYHTGVPSWNKTY